ncbi:MAG: Fe(3+) ABC transporter substrate-binding protein [Hyphomicrobiaceae bacterium]
MARRRQQRAPGRKRLAALLGALAAGFGTLAVLSIARAQDPGEVNIYSYREPPLIAPLIKAFTEKTGIKVNLLSASSGLAERMVAEGVNSPADVLLTVDVGRLTDAKEKGVSQAVSSKVLDANIPASFRDPEEHWFGLSMRARLVLASKDRIKQDTITYEDLADPKWKGKICVRSGRHIYNIALIASMIAHHDEAKAEAWLRGLKANLAHKPAGGDRDQIKDVAAGICDLAISNNYYLAALETGSPTQQSWAAAVKVLFPNASGRGSHVNISGAMLAKHAPNKANAIKFLEFLSSDDGQRIYAERVFEYPLKAGIPVADRVRNWGVLKADTLPMGTIAKLRKVAATMVDKVGFDQGPSN